MDFDEFGNPIGDELELGEEIEVKKEETESIGTNGEGSNHSDNGINEEDDDYMSDLDADFDDENLALESLRHTYGDQVEVLMEYEDRDANEPIVESGDTGESHSKEGVFIRLKKNIPRAQFDREYMMQMMKVPERIRTVCILGPLHSGKTSIADIFVLNNYDRLNCITKNIRLGWKQLRYMDNTRQEIERGMTLKLNGMTFLATDMQDKSHVINLLDTPGHVDFIDEVAVAMSVSDTALVCIDIIEGISSTTRYIIKECQKRGLSMVFLINKIDRLVLELMLPPAEAYMKLQELVLNIQGATKDSMFTPENNNILFASAKFGIIFSIEQFVSKCYGKVLAGPKLNEFVKRVWRNNYYDRGVFHPRTLNDKNHEATFVTFILNPIYKIFTHTLSREVDVVSKTLKKNFGVSLTEDEMANDPQPLLKVVFTKIFPDQKALVSSLTSCSGSGNYYQKQVNLLENGVQNTSSRQFLAHAVKNMSIGDSEWTLVKVYHGNIAVGDKISVIVPVSNISDSGVKFIDEEMLEEGSQHVIEAISLLGGRFCYPVPSASEGQLVLLKGISKSFVKSATLCSNNIESAGLPLFQAINYIGRPVFKVIIAPLNPKELPKLLSGLEKTNRYYPGLHVKVEESGEHVLLGNGELYFDCLMHDLRNVYGGIEVKISDPVTVFAESCQGESFAAIPVESSNHNISLTVCAEPLDKKIVQDISKKKLDVELLGDKKGLREMAKVLRRDYGWDSLAARNIWAFFHTSILVDDTLPDETDKNLLQHFREQILQGFYWAVREGPLMEEAIHGVKFRILKFEMSGRVNLDSLDVGIIGVQLIPLMRKACNVALLTAKPIVVEPIYEMDIIMKKVYYPVLEEVLKKRRSAYIYATETIPGTPLIEVKTQVPVIESFGLETDIRLSSEGNAIIQSHQWNDIWRKVPGDVMDEDAPIPKLKPAPTSSLSRDFVMKTRRRKGISNDGFMSNDGPTLQKYIDKELFSQLKEAGFV